MTSFSERHRKEVAEIHSQSSAAKLLALYKDGMIAANEVVNEAWSKSCGKPELRAKLYAELKSFGDEQIQIWLDTFVEMESRKNP